MTTTFYRNGGTFTELRRNLHTNPQLQGAGHGDSWGMQSGGGGPSVSSSVEVGETPVGDSFRRSQWNVGASGGTPGIFAQTDDLTPEVAYSSGFWIRPSFNTNFRQIAQFRQEGGGNTVGITGGDVFAFADMWTWVEVEAAVGDSVSNTLRLTAVVWPSTVPVGATIDSTAAITVRGHTLGQFFDGDTPATSIPPRTHAWDGSVGTSESIEYGPGYSDTLTPRVLLGPVSMTRQGRSKTYDYMHGFGAVGAVGWGRTRNGEHEMLFDTAAEAREALDFFASASSFILYDDEDSSLNMAFVLDQRGVTADQITDVTTSGTEYRWKVTVAYREVQP